MIQGIAVGGELPGSATFLIEHMFANKRGFAGSLVLCTAFLGIFLGSLTSSILSASFSYDYLLNWGWRYAYAVGGLLGFLGIYLRAHSEESPSFLKQTKTTEAPIQKVLVEYKHPLLMSILLTSILAMGNYTLIAYVTTHLVELDLFEFKDAILINFLSLFCLTCLIPLFGYISDRIGRKPVFISGVTGLMVFILPFFALLNSGEWGVVLVAETLFALILAPINATVPTIIAELFHTQVRASGTSIGYNIGQALFGGTLPMVSLILVKYFGSTYAPAWYILAWAVLVLIASYFLEESYQKAFA